METDNAKEIVQTFLYALNTEDFETARSCVGDNFLFEGVMGSRNGAEAYFQDMEKMRLKYDIQKVFAEGDDVCVLYDISMSGQYIYSCGWYRVNEGKIQSLKVVFDPRPLLTQTNGNQMQNTSDQGR